VLILIEISSVRTNLSTFKEVGLNSQTNELNQRCFKWNGISGIYSEYSIDRITKYSVQNKQITNLVDIKYCLMIHDTNSPIGI